MNFRNKLGLVLAIVMLITCFAGCAATAPAENTAGETDASTAEQIEPAGEPFIVGFSNVNDLYPYCIKLRDCLVEAAAKEGIEVLVADASGDADTQNGQIDNFIMQDAKVVSAISVDLDSSVPAVLAAQNAGIPYISFLTSVRDEGGYDQYIYIGSENYNAGLMQGQYLAEVLPENAVILYQVGVTGDSQYSERKQGLIDGLSTRADLKITAEVSTNNQKDKGITAMEDWMQAYDKIDCVVAQNDDSILGAIEAMKGANRLEGVITVGLDGSDDALVSIQNGELSMSVLQDAQAQAEAAVEIFKQMRDGVDPATIEDVQVPFQRITIDNVTDFMA